MKFRPWTVLVWSWKQALCQVCTFTAVQYLTCGSDYHQSSWNIFCRLLDADVGFVVVVDRRQDKWNALRTLLLRLTVSCLRLTLLWHSSSAVLLWYSKYCFWSFTNTAFVNNDCYDLICLFCCGIICTAKCIDRLSGILKIPHHFPS